MVVFRQTVVVAHYKKNKAQRRTINELENVNL